MTVRLLGAARRDADDAADWYDQQSPGVGVRFLAAVNAPAATLAIQPQLYAPVRRPPAGREIREGPVPKYPFIATYEVTAAEVVILSITHAATARRPWRSRLPDPPPP